MSSFSYTSYDAIGLAELVRSREVSPLNCWKRLMLA